MDAIPRHRGGLRIGAERSPTGVGDHHQANDLDRLAAGLDALAFLCCQPDVKETDCGDGHGEVPVGEVVAMPIRSSTSPGAFEPEMIATMSEAFEAACRLHATGRHEVVREVIARRIVIAAKLGERDPVRLQAAALAERSLEPRFAHSRSKSFNRFGREAPCS
jgi:hypothetical protein